MTVKRGRNFLMTPGPTPVPERILQAMNRQPIDISSDAFRTFALDCLRDIRPVFGTQSEVFLYAANGHGAWEAALSNVLSPGDKILLLETGNFALGWAETGRNLGLETEILDGDWRRSVPPERLEERLRADSNREIKAVLAVHTDTASSITMPVEDLKPAIDAAGHPALLMIDTIASLTTTPFEMDAWGIDVAVGACQKGLMMPPGLSFTAAGPRALLASEEATLPRRYWDWRQRLHEHTYRWFCGTAPIHLLYGLREALDMLSEEGLPAVIRRHARLAEAVRRAVAVWAEAGTMEFSAVEPSERADSVTTVLLTDGINGRDLIETCRSHFDVALGQGIARLDGKAFRIGHMGDVNEPTILGALASVEATMKMLQVPHGHGGVTAALEYLAETA